MVRWLIGSWCLAAVVVAAASGQDLRVLTSDKAGVPPSGMMHAYLMSQMRSAMDRREARYEQLKEVEQLTRYQAEMRAFFRESLGDLPDRTPLNPQVVAKEDRDGYRIEKIVFESQPRHYVTAILYLPATEPPYPAVLVPCGHSGNGKAQESYQRASILLAMNGLASFCYDPIEQGERYQLLSDEGKPVVGGTTAHCLVGVGSTLLGRNTATFRIWDGMRAIDYLQSRGDIDPARIGCTGNSGGGTLTSYLMALDERIVCAAPGCYLCGFRRLCETIGPQDAEQNIFGQISHGMDHADYILMHAPQPTLMCTATEDFFDIGGAWDCFRQAKRFYGKLGFAERVSLIEADEKHGFSKLLREGAVRWMRRWLLQVDDAICETDFPVAADQQLQCTPRGQVMLLEGARTTYDLNLDLEEKLVENRKLLWKQQDLGLALKRVREITGIRKLGDLPAPNVQMRGSVALSNGCEARKLILESEPGIQLPALLFIPEKRGGDATLYLHAEGKHVDAGEDGPIMALVAQGQIVLAIDVRGIGETGEPSGGRDGIGRHIGPQWKDFYLAYLLGRSFLAMRAEDILVSARFLRDFEASNMPNRVHLVSVGRVGPPALHAAALEPDLFDFVTLTRCLTSWTLVLRTPLATNQFENAVHGALRAYDLPDLLAALPRDKVLVHEPLDAQERPVRAATTD
ncbi:MAG: hypothetical protein FJ276_02395 [Planctomycetes bacterium]|nr:hypothetical protein [Planctomycetota bacterium]